MKCPIDNAELVMSERQGVEIDYCPQCRGVWLDRGELDKIMDKAAQMESRADAPRPDRSHRDVYSERHGRKKKESWLSELFD